MRKKSRLNCEKIWKYGRETSWKVKRYRKCRRKVGGIVKWYGKYGRKVYGRKVSWNVKWYGKYGRKTSRIMIRYGQYGRKARWIENDIENMEEK